MRRLQRLGLVAVIGAALAVTLATPASARKFQMSGTWFARNGGVFIPLQFAATVMGSMGSRLNLSMGNLTGAFGFPNVVPPGSGGVTATGTAPASIMLPKHRFVEDVAAALPLAGTTLVQVTTNFGVDAPYSAGTLAASGGPGSFTWCPGNAACVAGGGMLSTDPPNGGTRGGRIIYLAGPNRFGGAMQMGLKRGGDNVFLFNVAPFQAGHNLFGTAPPTRKLAPGGGFNDSPTTEMVFLKAGPVTQPTMAPAPFNLIVYPGPRLTTGFGLTNTASGPVFYLPVIATGPMGTRAGQFTTNYGFPHTTGTVIAQQTADYNGAQDFFTFMGSDGRTPLGAGNISTVAGGMSFRNTLGGQTPLMSMHKLSMTLGAPIPSISPPGLAAAGALMLLTAGYVLYGRRAR